MPVPRNSSSPAYAIVARRHKMHRGGFRSSICDLFSDPSRRADSCALACCGVLQSDKNRYLLNGEHPVWWKRLAINIGLPTAALALMIVLGAFAVDKDSDLGHWWAFLTLLVLAVVVGVVCIRGRLIRMRLRREIMNRMLQERNLDNVTENDFSLTRHSDRDSCCAHMTCCGCYHDDVIYTLAETENDQVDEVLSDPDFCTRIFQNLASLCCGVCCQCWCQCCGMCAIGQEERELTDMIPKYRQLIDYITFEVRLQ